MSPGLQSQRTALAWQRTSLALIANAALLIRAGLEREQVVSLVLGIGVSAAAALLAGAALWRQKALADAARPSGVSAWALGGVSLVACVACAGGLLSMLLNAA